MYVVVLNTIFKKTLIQYLFIYIYIFIYLLLLFIYLFNLMLINLLYLSVKLGNGNYTPENMYISIFSIK